MPIIVISGAGKWRKTHKLSAPLGGGNPSSHESAVGEKNHIAIVKGICNRVSKCPTGMLSNRLRKEKENGGRKEKIAIGLGVCLRTDPVWVS